MHDGRFKTIMEVLHHYNDGGRPSKNQDKRIRKLDLAQHQLEDLRVFLESLTDEQFVKRKDLKNPW
jgi:cytochrome c peroxidase